ncbi:O-antigen ligase family protein [Bacillus sp. T3]|uniref:O-antigen ligase family protein n=1 Tax=Bacillus sp. T3 TaxID=467262 RepID=UPI002980D6E6|nr:O-antigen ligase family protein [Bacillus sp. T3]
MQWGIFVVLSLIFLFTPYQKGLYFPNSLYGIVIFLSLLCVLVVILPFIKKENKFLKTSVVFLLPLWLLIFLPFAETPKGSWDLIIKWVFCVEFFFLLTWSSLNSTIKKAMPLMFHVNGILLSLFMLLNFYGVLNYRDAILNDRFAGAFQYPNTFGMVMALFFFYTLVNLTTEKNKKLVILYSSSLVPFFLCFIMSFSRGMMLVFTLVWLIGLSLLSIRLQLRYILFTALAGISSLIVFISIENGQVSQRQYPGFFILVLMMLFTVAIVLLINKKIRSIKNPKIQKIMLFKFSRLLIPSLVVVSLVLGLLDLKNEGLLFKTLPEGLQKSVSGITLDASTAKERLYLYQDALKMSKDSPLFGFGGGGWATLFNHYQQIPYQATKIHNGYLEWVIDAGWIGLILLICIFSYLSYLLLKSRNSEEKSIVYVAIFIALLSAAAHSFIDFDLSYGTVLLLIFWLFAMGISKEQLLFNPMLSKKIFSKATSIKFIYICIVALALITSYKAYNYYDARQLYIKAVQKKNISSKEELMNQTISKDPDNIKYYLDLSNTYMAEGLMNNKAKENSQNLILKMTAVEPNNSVVLHSAALLSQKIGDNNKAIKYYDLCLKYDRYNSKLYEDSIEFKIKLALLYLNRNEKTSANTLLNSALKDFNQINKWKNHYNKLHLGEEFNSREFHITGPIYYYSSLAYFIKGDFQQSNALLSKITDEEDIYLNAVTLRIMSLEKMGKLEESQKLYSNTINDHNELLKKLNEYKKFLDK